MQNSEELFTEKGCVQPFLSRVSKTVNFEGAIYYNITSDCDVVVADVIPEEFKMFRLICLPLALTVLLACLVKTYWKYKSLDIPRLWYRDISFLNFVRTTLLNVGTVILSFNPGQSSLIFTRWGIAVLYFWLSFFVLSVAWTYVTSWMKALASLASYKTQLYERLHPASQVLCFLFSFFAMLPPALNPTHEAMQFFLFAVEIFLLGFGNFFFGLYVLVYTWRNAMDLAKEGSSLQREMLKKRKRVIHKLVLLVLGSGVIGIITGFLHLWITIKILAMNSQQELTATSVLDKADVVGIVSQKIMAAFGGYIAISTVFLIVTTSRSTAHQATAVQQIGSPKNPSAGSYPVEKIERV